MINKNDINDLLKAAEIADFNLFEPDMLELQVWEKGIDTHIPVKLPEGKCAVYIFEYAGEFLKVGQVGSKSSARFLSQHYNPKSSNSNLAKSLEKNKQHYSITEDVNIWIKKNTTRYNILIPANSDKQINYFLNFAEAFFILKCKPKFER